MVTLNNMVTTQNQLNIDVSHVLGNIGYDTEQEPTARIMSLVNEYVENAYHLIEPSYTCVIRDVNLVWGSHVFIEGTITLKSEVVAQLLKKCGRVAIFALTIGGHVEETVSRLAEDGLILQASVLDAIGSVAVESLADFGQGRISELARSQGLGISRRFSPGYCDWSVDQQKAIFRALDGSVAGVQLTDGCLMLPQKSISGIIGIGAKGKRVESYNPCKKCDKVDCRGRR